MASSTTRRKSVFHEHITGQSTPSLDTVVQQLHSDSDPHPRPAPNVRFRSSDDVRVVARYDVIPGLMSGDSIPRTQHTKNASTTTSADSIHTLSPLPARNRTTMYRLSAAIALLVAVVPLLHSTSFFGHATLLQPVSGSAIPNARSEKTASIDRRADSPTNVCFRWAQQSAIVNGTLYLYGGQATTEAGQTENTWNNNFLSLDLTKTWQISTPALTGQPQPSGPPAVSLGYLWNSHESLYVYGGEFSWKPAVSPTAFSAWEYSIANAQWIEHSNPVTSNGVSAPSNDQPVQRAAEGAGANVPSLGRGFYFGGHLDGYTTEGWSQSIPRVYLQSLLEFTFPGSSNTQVSSLSNGQDAGSDGSYRNITEGGLQAEAGFTQRADGLLIYVPGFGKQGILLALAGGTNETFTQMNNINVYDIAESSWYVQTTSGSIPDYRVNPCAVIAAAPDGSSYNIYMFGGQNLIPAGNQTQKNDMWILSLPSFTWIEVDMAGQSVPYGRSGHTCNVWDGQMVMVGGYVGDQSLTCESPGIYVFDMSATQWVNEFTAKSPGADDSSSTSTSMKDNGSGSSGSNNPFNQQPNQKYSADNSGGLEGSYGYTVPQVVIDVVGGDKSGGATLTTPVNTATAGPMATGKPITYTLPDGSTTTSTSSPSSGGNGGSGSGSSSNSSGSGVNVGAIVAGCVAGVLGVVAIYLLYCVFIYRKRLALYKRHVEMSQAQARGEKTAAMPGLYATNTSSGKSGSSHSHHGSGGGSSSSAAGQYGGGYNPVRRSSDVSANEDLLSNQEPTFFGTFLHPRRSLRVVNRD